ncbi:MAG TPA: abortive infection family protein [Gallionellaceae bacterium]|nr:abortive infection family protein [Gallionellaceae bacterium]
MTLPITDTIIAALAQLVDDSKSNGEYREPSHSDIEFYVGRSGLTSADPKAQGQVIGKAKRVRAILSWAIDNNPNAGSKLIEQLLSKVRASGGFREQSANFVGSEAILNAISAFDAEGYELSKDGDIRPKVLESLKGRELTQALQAYARRAQKGAQDAALLSGTGKDLLEATAAHILQTKWGSYSSGANFQGLLGQAYVALGLTVPEQAAQPSEPQTKALERAMFQTACAINRLRNKEGTGHGRPWLPSITNTEATAAIEMVGSIASFLLSKLDENR